MGQDGHPSTTGEIRTAIRQGRIDAATGLLTALLADVTGQPVTGVRLNADRYSLNSVNGLAEAPDGTRYFFKFHQEDGEETGVSEYYNARVLADAGYAVAQPLFQATTPGRQVLVYARRTEPRFSDVCASLDAGDRDPPAREVTAAQATADRNHCAIALNTLRWCDAPAALEQPIFQLFFNRLVDDPRAPGGLGGRVDRFYRGRHVDWPGLSARFEDLWDRRWIINGRSYPLTLKDGFTRGLKRLAPAAFLPGPVITAHGDAHNANVWYHPAEDGVSARLSLFDPAFAGDAVPVLMAEIKATFHNIFAHPFWLYDPDGAAARYTADARLDRGAIVVETNHALTPLRQAFADTKARHFWAPLLRALDNRGWLPADWEAVMRLLLFACPTLVMNLLPGADSPHNPVSSLIGFAQAVRTLSRPEEGIDMVSSFFHDIRTANGWAA